MSTPRQIDDPTFPGLHLALDTERMRELLVRTLPECRDGLAVEELRIFQVQYRPRRRCSILYSAKLRPPGGRSRQQFLAAELLGPNDRPQAPDAALVRRFRESGERLLRHPVVELREVPLVLHAFPYDPALPDLIDACDEERMKHRLGRLWKPRGVRVRQVSVRPLGFTPGQRAALLYETLAEERATGLPEVRRLVGKMDLQRDAADLFARNWSVWRAAQLRFRMPPPVGFLPDPRLFLQEQVEGERLSDLAGTGEFIGPVRQTARAIAVLHELPLPLRFRRASLQSVKSVARWTKVLRSIRPQERKRIDALGERLTAELESRAVVTGPIHADLHPSNLLVHDGNVVLIDFDNMVLGDRLLDVGRFVSALRTSALRVTGRPDGLADVGENFLEHYLSHTGEDARRARLFEAAALMVSAGTGFRLQRDGWEQTAGWLLDECERALERSGTSCGSPPRRPSSAAMKRRDAAADRARPVDRVEWAGDPQYLRGLLEPHVREIYGAGLHEVEPEQKAPRQRREHLRFRVHGWRGDEKFRVALDGFVRPGKSGRSQAERLEILWRALDGVAHAPRLPRPVAYFRELGLQVVEPPRGVAIAQRIAEGDGVVACAAVGRSLARLHRASAALGKTRPLEGELDDVRRAVARTRDSAIGTAVVDLLAELEPLVAADRARTAPALRHLSPRRVLIDDGVVGVAEVDDVAIAHPCFDVADLLMRLDPHATAAADALRRAYAEASGVPLGVLAAFESLVLIRAACAAARRSDRTRAEALVDRAEARFGPVGARRNR